MGVDQGGLYITVTQQLLNRADVGALLQEVYSERMAEGVAGGWLAELVVLPPESLNLLLLGQDQRSDAGWGC